MKLSHDCWDGSYTNFHKLRTALADAAGLPPLWLMEGFYSPKSTLGLVTVDDLRKAILWIEKAPVAWTSYESDVLTKFLNHPDTEGQIEAHDCGPLADRIAGLLPALLHTWMFSFAVSLVDGLRRAASRNEPVIFE